MFYLILTIVLIIFTVLFKKSQKLNPKKRPFSKLGLGIYISIIVVICGNVGTYRNDNYYFNKLPDLTIKAPKRLFFPKQWHQVPKDVDLKQFGDKVFTNKDVYDRQLFVAQNRNLLYNFTLDSETDVRSVYQKCYIEKPGSKFEFDDRFNISYQLKGNGLFSEKDFLPFTYYQLSSNSFDINSKKLEKLVDDFQIGNKKRIIYANMVKINDRIEPPDEIGFGGQNSYCSSCFLVPYSSSEEMVEVSIEKLYSILYPYGNSNVYNQLISSLNKGYVTSCQFYSTFPLLIFESLGLFSLFVILGVFLNRRITLSIILAVFSLVIYKISYDLKNATNDLYTFKNRFALPSSRDYQKQKTETVEVLTSEFDSARFYQNVLLVNRYKLDYQFSEQTNSPFYKISFLDDDKFVDLFLVKNHREIRTYSKYGSSGGNGILSDIFNYAIDRVKQLRHGGVKSVMFCFDVRTFSVKAMSERSAGESVDDFIRKEFINFFDELAEREKLFLGGKSEK